MTAINRPAGRIRQASGPTMRDLRNMTTRDLATMHAELAARTEQAARDSGCADCTGRADEIVRHMESHGRSRVQALLIVAATLAVIWMIWSAM